ncbi:MAG: LysE family translocator [Myxococcota bacterium]
MIADMLFASFAAGMLYVLVPGPATLAALSLSASDGRLACLRFLSGHMFGDLFWSIIAVLAIIGVSQLGPTIFHALGIVCGLYLILLGFRALLQKQHVAIRVVTSPWRTGIVFGFINPKAYPFALALFTSVLSRFGSELSLASLLPIALAAFLGFVVATGCVVFWTGLRVVRRTYAKNSWWLVKATGLVFIALGAKSFVDAVQSLRVRAEI